MNQWVNNSTLFSNSKQLLKLHQEAELGTTCEVSAFVKILELVRCAFLANNFTYLADNLADLLVIIKQRLVLGNFLDLYLLPYRRNRHRSDRLRLEWCVTARAFHSVNWVDKGTSVAIFLSYIGWHVLPLWHRNWLFPLNWSLFSFFASISSSLPLSSDYFSLSLRFCLSFCFCNSLGFLWFCLGLCSGYFGFFLSLSSGFSSLLLVSLWSFYRKFFKSCALEKLLNYEVTSLNMVNNLTYVTETQSGTGLILEPGLDNVVYTKLILWWVNQVDEHSHL